MVFIFDDVQDGCYFFEDFFDDVICYKYVHGVIFCLPWIHLDCYLLCPNDNNDMLNWVKFIFIIIYITL